jgi:hypothetical protein
MILLVEDDETKRKCFAANGIHTKEIIGAEQFEIFLAKEASIHGGYAVLDVGNFDGLGPIEMIERGHRLVDLGWEVVFWSALVDVHLHVISEKCWVERDSTIAGAAKIVSAIKTDFEPCGLRRGLMQASYELSLQVLFALFVVFSSYWESVLEGTSREELIKRLRVPEIEGFERTVAERFLEHLTKKASQPWMPGAHDETKMLLDGVLGSSAKEERVTKLWCDIHVSRDDVPTDLDSALTLLSTSSGKDEWYERLSALRDMFFFSRDTA